MNQRIYFMDRDKHSDESEPEPLEPEREDYGRRGLDDSDLPHPKILPPEPWPESKPDRSTPKPDK